MKKFFAYFGLLFLISALISCSALNSDDSASGLVVQLPSKSARSATSTIPEWAKNIDYFTVEVASHDGKSYKEQNQSFQTDSESTQKSDATVATQTATWGTTVRFEELPAGLYTVKVLAKTKDNKTLGGNENENTPVKVEEGKATSVTITIKEYSLPNENSDNTDSSSGSEENDSESEETKDSEKEDGNANNEEISISPVSPGDEKSDEPADTEDSDDANTPAEDDVDTDDKDSEDEEIEFTFDGKVLFNNKEYETLSEALLAAATVSPTSGVNTITLNGNIKENLLANDDGSSPWLIEQNLIIDLKENTLFWAEFTDSLKNNQTENPLFQVASNAKLLIKNGTITSESGVEHSNILLGTTGGTIALENVTIKNVNAPYVLSINSSLNASGATENSGALYCDSVTIKDCEGLKTSIDGTESLGVPISINASEFYAKEMTIENTTGANGLHAILMNSDSLGSFVGGSITLNNETDISKGDGSAIALISSSLYVSSSTIFANSKYYGAPVKVVASGQLNLSKGFQFKTFKENRFDASYESNGSSDWITAETLGLKESESRVVAGTSVSDSASTQTAIVVGKKEEESTSTSSENEIKIKGQFFVSGKASVYGVVDLFFKSSIGVTGALETSETETIKVKFEDIASYASASGDYPLFWASGSDSADENKDNAASIATKFEVYGDTDYTISATDRKIQYAGTGDEKNGNTIYAPVLTSSNSTSSATATGSTATNGGN